MWPTINALYIIVNHLIFVSNANLIELKSCMYSNCMWCQNNCKGVNFPERHPPQKICRYTYLSTLFILHCIVDLLRTFPDIHKSGWSYVMWSCVYILCCVITGPRTELHTRADDFLYIKQRFEKRGDGAATCELWASASRDLEYLISAASGEQ